MMIVQHQACQLFHDDTLPKPPHLHLLIGLKIKIYMYVYVQEKQVSCVFGGCHLGFDI